MSEKTISEQSGNAPALTPDQSAAIQKMIAEGIAAGLALAQTTSAPSAPSVVTGGAVRMFDDTPATPNSRANGARATFYAIVVGCGEHSGIFACSDNFSAYRRALSVRELFSSQGKKWRGNGKSREWRGVPVDDKDTGATGRYLFYCNADEIQAYRNARPRVVWELENGYDGRGAKVKADAPAVPAELLTDAERAELEKVKAATPAPAAPATPAQTPAQNANKTPATTGAK